MTKASVSHSKIIRINNDKRSEADDLLASEEPLEIRIGYGTSNERHQKNISVTMRTPGNDFELALGFLFTEGIIKDKNDITQIKYCTEANTKENNQNIVRAELKENIELDFKKLERNFYTTSSCGVCGKASIDAIRTECKLITDNEELRINKYLLFSLPDRLREEQKVFEHTGGLHACALFNSKGELLLLREDVGRHNALDKLIGAALGSSPTPPANQANQSATGRHELRVPLNNHILLLSGRASFELLQKAAMAGISIVCAVGAPSSLAVEMANEFGITLIGFLRDNRFNIYSNPERIF